VGGALLPRAAGRAGHDVAGRHHTPVGGDAPAPLAHHLDAGHQQRDHTRAPPPRAPPAPPGDPAGLTTPSSPGATPATPSATASTTPATSHPGTWGRWGRGWARGTHRSKWLRGEASGRAGPAP